MRSFSILLVAFGCAACDSESPVGPDAGLPDLGGPELSAPTMCTLGTRVCDPDIGCTDGCNWCGCSVMGTPTGGTAACTQLACLAADGGTVGARCTSAADCGTGERCVFDRGCADPQGRCSPADACTRPGAGIGGPQTAHDVGMICTCNHQVVSASTLCGVEQPYLNVGACK